jgi:hypothetical protein
VRKLPVPEPEKLSPEHKAILLVVIGYRRKGGVSKVRLAEILSLDPSLYLGFRPDWCKKSFKDVGVTALS